VLKGKLAGLQNKSSGLGGEILSKKTGLASAVKADRKETDDAQREFSSLSNQLAAAKDKLNKVNEEIVSLQDDIKANGDNETNLQRDLDKLKADYKEVQIAAGSGDNEVTKLRAEIVAKENETKPILDKIEEVTAKLNDEIDNFKKCQSEESNLKNQADTHGKGHADIQAKIDTFQAQLVQHDQANEKLLGLIKELNDKLVNIVAEHKKELDSENAEIAGHKWELEKTLHEINLHDKEIEKITSEISNATSEIGKTNDDINGLRAQEEAKQKDIEDNDVKITSLKGLIAKSENQIKNLSVKIDALEKTFADEESKTADCNSKLDALQKEVTDNQKLNDDSKAKIDSLLAEIASKEEEKRKKEEEKKKVEAELTKKLGDNNKVDDKSVEESLTQR